MDNRTFTPSEARKRVKAIYSESKQHTRNGKGSWHYVARQLGLTTGTVIRIAHGYEPRRADIRRKLGLPVFVSVAPCDVCGQVHIGEHPKPTRRRKLYHLHELPTEVIARMMRERTDYAQTKEQRAAVTKLLEKKAELVMRLRRGKK